MEDNISCIAWLKGITLSSMAVATFSKLDLDGSKLRRRLETVAEADIRDDHGEPVTRPSLLSVPPYLYHAVIHDLDDGQKLHDAEVDAQRRALDGTSPI